MYSVTESEIVGDVDARNVLPLLCLQRVVFEHQFCVAVALGQGDAH